MKDIEELISQGRLWDAAGVAFEMGDTRKRDIVKNAVDVDIRNFSDLSSRVRKGKWIWDGRHKIITYHSARKAQILGEKEIAITTFYRAIDDVVKLACSLNKGPKPTNWSMYSWGDTLDQKWQLVGNLMNLLANESSVDDAIFPSGYIHVVMADTYQKVGDPVLAARFFQKVGDIDSARDSWDSARPMLLNLQYGGSAGVKIADEMGDPLLALQVAEEHAKTADDFHRFYAIKYAAERAHVLGREDDAVRLYKWAVDSALTEGCMTYHDLDGGIEPHHIAEWSRDFELGEAQRTVNVYAHICRRNPHTQYARDGIKYAVESGMMDQARKMAEPVLRCFTNGRTTNHTIASEIAILIGETEKAKEYQQLSNIQ